MELTELVETLHTKRDSVLVTTNGVFDILHVGHVRYLEAAKALGDILVVAINSDASVREIKGPSRPFNSEQNRAAVVGALRCVDYVVIFGEKTAESVIRHLRPNIHVKGGDYTVEQVLERAVVEEIGGKVVVVDKIECSSTTELARMIVMRNAP